MGGFGMLANNKYLTRPAPSKPVGLFMRRKEPIWLGIERNPRMEQKEGRVDRIVHMSRVRSWYRLASGHVDAIQGRSEKKKIF